MNDRRALIFPASAPSSCSDSGKLAKLAVVKTQLGR